MIPCVLDKGAFADVLDLMDGTVVKAFRREEQAGGGCSWEDEDALTTKLFAAEARAYEMLMGLPELAIYTPKFFARVDPCALVGDDEREKYVQGCGIHMERISGVAVKVTQLTIRTKAEVEPILKRFAEEVTT